MLKRPLFLIIDGMSQAYRAYFAIRGLASSQGLPTNAVYGFAIMLKRVLEKYPPDYIAVALDSSERTARHAQYEFYKATRKKMPPDLSQQLPYIRRFCEAMRISVLEIPGHEAAEIVSGYSRTDSAEQAPGYNGHETADPRRMDRLQSPTAGSCGFNAAIEGTRVYRADQTVSSSRCGSVRGGCSNRLGPRG